MRAVGNRKDHLPRIRARNFSTSRRAALFRIVIAQIAVPNVRPRGLGKNQSAACQQQEVVQLGKLVKFACRGKQFLGVVTTSQVAAKRKFALLTSVPELQFGSALAGGARRVEAFQPDDHVIASREPDPFWRRLPGPSPCSGTPTWPASLRISRRRLFKARPSNKPPWSTGMRWSDSK